MKHTFKKIGYLLVLAAVLALQAGHIPLAKADTSNPGWQINMYLERTTPATWPNFVNSNSATITVGQYVQIRQSTTFSNSLGYYPCRGVLDGVGCNNSTVVHWVANSCPTGSSCVQQNYHEPADPLAFPYWSVLVNAPALGYTGPNSPHFTIQTSAATPPGVYQIVFRAEEHPATWGAPLMTPATQTFFLTVTAPPKPTIALSPPALNFSNIEGQPGPAAQSLTIRNTGSAAMNWTATTNQTWCHISPASGSIAAGAQATPAISVDVQAPGTRTCAVTVTDANATNSPQAATVNYTVIPRTVVTLTASPASVAYNGASTLTWSTTGSPTSCTASGSWSGAKAVSGTQSTGALTANQNYTLTCTGPGGTDAKSVAVSVGAQPSAVIGLSPASLTFNAVSGQAAPPAQNVTITNTAAAGSKNLNWTATTNQTWCHISPASGTLLPGTSAIVPVTMDAPSVTGAFTCTVTVSDPAASPTSRTLAANYTVIPATAVTLTASPASVAYNGASTLTWSTTGSPTSCTASGSWSGAKAVSGTQSTGALTANQNYTLTCTGPGGTDAKSASVAVGVQPPTVTFSATQTSIPYNGSTSLNWNATGGPGIACTASGSWSGAKAVSGTQSTGNLISSQNYTLTCTNPGGTDTKTVTVNVGPQPTALTFNAAQTSIAYNGSTSLNWNAIGAAPVACTASGSWSGAKAVSGTQSTGALTATQTYNLSCTGPGGTDSKIVTVNVGAQPLPGISLNPGSLTFTATSQGANPGSRTTVLSNPGTATLNWTTSNTAGKPGTWCHVSPSSGSLVPNATANITATVDNPSNVGTFSDCGITFSDQTFPAITGNLGFIYDVVPGSCPAASVQSVPASLVIGQTATAAAPAGFSGGTFSSSNSAAATVNSSSGLINAIAVGSTNISGSGWSYPFNGATSCSLSSQPLSVTANMNPPTDFGIINTGATVSCKQIRLSWKDNSVGEAGFKVYRNTASDPAAALLVATIPSTSVGTTGTDYSYTDNTPLSNQTYHYWVTSYVAAIESGRAAGYAGSANSTPCEANLSNSNKDIVEVNGVASSANTCSDNEYPNVAYKVGDAVKFNINLCNGNTTAGAYSASQIVVEDTLVNLEPAFGADPTLVASWDAQASGGLNIDSISVLSGSAPANLKIRIVLSGSIVANSAATLSLNAKIAFPSGFSGTSSRFQNNASISYFDGTAQVSVPVTKSTPLLLFTAGATPSKIETAPK